MADWDEGYSSLIHGIEARLSEHITSSPNPVQSDTRNDTFSSGSGQKRPRVSDQFSADEEDNIFFVDRDIDIDTINQNADKMKLTAQIDESRLLNEQLTDKLKRVCDEFGRHKEKTVKQLKATEAENNQVRDRVRVRFRGWGLKVGL